MTNTRRVGSSIFQKFYEYHIHGGDEKITSANFFVSRDFKYEISRNWSDDNYILKPMMNSMNEFYSKFKVNPCGDINYINRMIKRLKIK